MVLRLRRGAVPAPFRLAAAAAVAVAAGPAGFAWADPAPPFEVLLRQAEAASPRTAEALADLQRAQGLADQAAVRPNPTAELTLENLGVRHGGIDQRETTLSIAQPFELGGKRSARMAAGAAGVAAARARQAQARADLAADLAEAYAQAEAADRRLGLASEAADLAAEDARVAAVLVETGKEAEVRSILAGAAAAAARSEVEARRGEREAAFAKLTAAAGSAAPLTSIEHSLLAQPAPDLRPPDPLSTAAYAAAQAEREAAARRVRVEQARATPDVVVSVGVRRLSAESATALVAGVSAPIPVFDRNRGGVSAARADLAAAEARLNAARLDAEAAARAGAARLAAARRRIEAARTGGQGAEEVYRLTRLGYEGGKLPLLEVLNARRALVEARAALVDAQADLVSAAAALARLGAQPFAGVR